ncbi:response regulator [Nostoc sp. FACHB-145]|uniref:hybrid sensor histidine kinase/response regulator n=1 Tax=Nostoc sp. FACHB-145 TaxID=2692836 RepID=UPI001684C7F1|nr:response regulator [Nostoc sp. FACHB-145]MBD2466278.1 response regulator [Nostoc sp. FACHB-145]
MTSLLKPASQTNILLVDDTPDNLRLLAKILELQGYVVRKSLNGKMALQAASREPPDLILLDINMPDMSGYEVCQQLKILEKTSNIPIIFISALDSVSDKIRAFEMGGQDYITKPFQELEVLARIRHQLLIQQQHQRLEQEIQERLRAEAQVKLLNQNLELTVELRTQQLQQSLNFEATLKRISDKVRDTLNQHQILQTAVEELAIALDVKCCDAVLYTSDRQSSIIRYQYVASGHPHTQGQMLYVADAPEIYHQLQQQKSYFAFCQIQATPIRNHAAILACSIFDDQVEAKGIVGDLWLFKDIYSTFSDMEIHLVQQVANQCAIALRQAYLYEAAQAQVEELQKLNQLKDDFLCTISHELRSPIATIKMIVELLNNLSEQEDGRIEQNSQLSCQYFAMLQSECDRELGLIENILSLQHLQAGTYPQQLTNINIHDLILHIIEPLETQFQNQQQTFEINLAPDLPTIEIDSSSLTHILTELLNNARKYTPAGEKISLVVTVIQDETATEDKIPERFASKPSFLQLIISNTGVTIATEELTRIFDKFYRIPSQNPWKHSGTGLGLALVKKLVEQMNGKIVAQSANNLTQFIVRLPVVHLHSVTEEN